LGDGERALRERSACGRAEVLEAYADGVNYYAALRPEKLKRGMLPVTGKDVAAGFAFKMPFFYGLDKTLRG